MFLPSKAVFFPCSSNKKHTTHSKGFSFFPPAWGRLLCTLTKPRVAALTVRVQSEARRENTLAATNLGDGQSECEVRKIRPSASGLTLFAPGQSQRLSPCTRQVSPAPPSAPREEMRLARHQWKWRISQVCVQVRVCVCVWWVGGWVEGRGVLALVRLAEITITPP